MNLNFTLVYELRANDPRLYIHMTALGFNAEPVKEEFPRSGWLFPGIGQREARTRFRLALRLVSHQGQSPRAPVGGVAGKRRQEAGVLLLNDSKHGHSLDGNTLRLTLIRAVMIPIRCRDRQPRDTRLLWNHSRVNYPWKAMAAVGKCNHPLKIIARTYTKAHWPGDLSRRIAESFVLCPKRVEKAHHGNPWC